MAQPEGVPADVIALPLPARQYVFDLIDAADERQATIERLTRERDEAREVAQDFYDWLDHLVNIKADYEYKRDVPWLSNDAAKAAGGE